MKRIISALVALAMVLTLIPAVSIAEDSSVPVGEEVVFHYYGDANFDEKLNTADATKILRISSDIESLTEEQQVRTYEGYMKIDANKDDSFNTADASYILKVSAEMVAANIYYDAAPEEPTEQPTGEPTEQPTGEPTEQPTGEPTEQPTGEPTEQPTGEPTEQPTGEPTAEPTQQPTQEPTQAPDAYVVINCYDSFNEQQVAAAQMAVHDGQNRITADNIVLPEDDRCTYVLENSNFSVTITVTNGVASPASISVNVVPMVADEEGNEYKVIFTVKGFDKVNKDLAGNYALGVDLDFGGASRQPFGWNWEDPSQEDQVFSGIFDGCGHYVLDYDIDYSIVYDSDGEYYYSNTGLFSTNTGTIRNLGVLGWVFSDVNVGMLVGTNAGLIEECYCYGNVASMDCMDMSRGAAGGICGQNHGQIVRSCFEGSVAGFYWIGGITGKNFGTISETYFAGDVNNGLDDDIIYDYGVRYIGGIAGGSTGTIQDCYVYCAPFISGDKAVGGMCGWVSGGTLKNIFVVNALEYGNDYVDDAVGYVASAPQYSGLTASDDENLPMPSGYSSQIWDMNGASHKTFPDLINNRRAADGFYVD